MRRPQIGMIRNRRVLGVETHRRGIEQSEWLTNPQLTVIETKEVGGQRLSDFTLVAKQQVKKLKAFIKQYQ